jgi:endonuclease/exonuclease/phosphatase family metal-dependent hydrolase
VKALFLIPATVCNSTSKRMGKLIASWKTVSGNHTPIAQTIRLLTYNIHSGVGVDRRYDLDRIHRVLLEEKPDIAALQEVDCHAKEGSTRDQAAQLAEGLGISSSFCATRPSGKGSFGIAVLSRFPVLHRQTYDLSHGASREPRFCLRVDLQVEDGAALHVFNCHLGLGTGERTHQRKKMLSDAILLNENLHHPVVLMGDFNDRPLPVVSRTIRRHFKDAYRSVGKFWGPTFRAGPLGLRLDYIYLSPEVRVIDCFVRRDSLARVASDHRPVVATIATPQITA